MNKYMLHVSPVINLNYCLHSMKPAVFGTGSVFYHGIHCSHIHELFHLSGDKREDNTLMSVSYIRSHSQHVDRKQRETAVSLTCSQMITEISI